MCGITKAAGVEIHVDHIKPKDKGGRAIVENGQLLCADHNFRKKNLNQTEMAKSLFINLKRLAKQAGDKKIEAFASDVLKIYDEHGINGHIEWDKD